MTINVNLEESLRGLWLGEGPGAYLTKFFPRLSVGQPHLIPVQSGFNVLYGRNGAGKTQILNAVAAASQWEMGPLEGFLLKGPVWKVGLPSTEIRMSALSSEEILESISDEDSSALDLGWTWGYHRSFVTEQRLPDVLAIIDEFRSAGTVILTRGLRQDTLQNDSWSLRRHHLLPPNQTEIVPILLPGSEAPATRRHLVEMRETLLAAVTDAMDSINYRRELSEYGTWDFVDSAGRDFRDARDEAKVEDALTPRMEQWRENWAWSPLLNARNVGCINLSMDGHSSEFGDLAIHSSAAGIFLPPIHVEVEEAYSDFGSEAATPVFRPFQEQQEPGGQGKLLDEMEFQGSTFGKSPEEIEEMSRHYFTRELCDLKARLRFLPNYSHALAVQPAFDSPTEAHLTIGSRIPASAGSRAEVRWLEFARTAKGNWLLFDEPEAGLHRTAETDLALTLVSPAWSEITRTNRRGTSVTSRTIVVATHSPEFLALPEVNILHVDEGCARHLTSIDRENLAILGLRPADLLSRVKTFLLVEGEHERIVFETLLGEELHRLRASLVVARGGKNMKDVFDSQVLFNFSDARVVALLDNMSAEHVHDLWQRARGLAATGKVDEAGSLVREELPPQQSGENRFLAQFLTRAIEDGEHERVGAWGLAKEDIVLYLPPAAFGIKRSWEDALDGYAPDQHGSLKPWLTKKFGAEFSLETVRAGVDSLDEIPQEFTELLLALDLAQASPSGELHTPE